MVVIEALLRIRARVRVSEGFLIVFGILLVMLLLLLLLTVCYSIRLIVMNR